MSLATTCDKKKMAALPRTCNWLHSKGLSVHKIWGQLSAGDLHRARRVATAWRAVVSEIAREGMQVRCRVLQCVAVCWSVLQCVAVRCSVLQCVAVCCSVLQFDFASRHIWNGTRGDASPPARSVALGVWCVGSASAIDMHTAREGPFVVTAGPGVGLAGGRIQA